MIASAEAAAKERLAAVEAELRRAQGDHSNARVDDAKRRERTKAAHGAAIEEHIGALLAAQQASRVKRIDRQTDRHKHAFA